MDMTYPIGLLKMTTEGIVEGGNYGGKPRLENMQ